MLNDDEIYGEAFAVDCSMTEGDWLEVTRVGPPGHPVSVVAVTAFVADAEVETLDDGSGLVVRAPIMLSTADARRAGISLIAAADEADGIETSFFPDIQGADYE